MGIFDKKPKCPYCGSKKIFREKKGFHFKPTMLIPIIGAVTEMAEVVKSKQMQWHCEKCGETWDDE
jgi:predicted RNA-binding Zn-ribbon protein involved in translation (DUF1610 family)